MTVPRFCVTLRLPAAPSRLRLFGDTVSAPVPVLSVSMNHEDDGGVAGSVSVQADEQLNVTSFVLSPLTAV